MGCINAKISNEQNYGLKPKETIFYNLKGKKNTGSRRDEDVSGIIDKMIEESLESNSSCNSFEENGKSVFNERAGKQLSKESYSVLSNADYDAKRYSKVSKAKESEKNIE